MAHLEVSFVTGTVALADWDQFVQQCPSGLLYHTSAWKFVLEHSFSHIRGSIIVLREPLTRKIVAGIPIFTVGSALLGTRIVSVPFGTICDPLAVPGISVQPLIDEVLKLRTKVRARRIELRTFAAGDLYSASKLVKKSSFYKQHFLNLKPDIDPVQRYSASLRRTISRAKRKGLEVVSATNPDHLSVVARLIASSRSRLGLPQIPSRFFLNLQRHLSRDQLLASFAIHNGRPVAALLALSGEGVVALEFSGETVEGRELGAVQLLISNAVQAAHQSRGKIVHFGRTAPANDGIIAHKRSWGASENDLNVFTSSCENSDNPEKSLSYRTIRALLRHAPRCMHRILGDFCYRHLG